jgi:hypothetical protein
VSWTHLSATFEGLAEDDHMVDEHPTGSETGPTVYKSGKNLCVDGSLRDFDDHDAPSALAWFLRVCDLHVPRSASLTIDVGDGPRYRYRWTNGQLTKLRGVLD